MTKVHRGRRGGVSPSLRQGRSWGEVFTTRMLATSRSWWTGAMTASASSPERALLRDAIGEIADTARAISREPVGTGSIAGFELPEGDTTTLVYVDTSALPVAAETGLAQPGVGRIWTHPADPHLPALAPAAFGHAISALLARVGDDVIGEPEIVAYRAGRRAVLRVDTAAGVRWIKVVRPHRVERIVDTHRALARADLPVPAVIAWSPTGLVVIEQAAGTPAPRAAWTAVGLIDAVDELRERLAAVPSSREVPGAASRARWYRDRVVVLEERWRDRVDRVLAAVDREGRRRPVTIHGDLHFGQLFLDGRATHVTGLVDVDTVGRGDPAEDAAAFIAHAITSWHMSTADDARARLAELVGAADDRWSADEEVGRRAAAQLLGFAVAALETGERERAAALVAEAERRARRAS